MRAEIERQYSNIGARHAAIARDREAITAALKRCDRALGRWKDAFEAEVIDLGEFKEKRAEIDAHRASLQDEQQRLDQEEQALDQAVNDAEMLVALCRKWQDNLEAFDMLKKRKVLESLNIRVYYSPGQPIKIVGNPSVFPEPFIAHLALQ
jgi:hypothetical protein